jgi:hypothetical protein
MKQIINFVQDEIVLKWNNVYYDIINYNIENCETIEFVPCYKYMKTCLHVELLAQNIHFNS